MQQPCSATPIRSTSNLRSDGRVVHAVSEKLTTPSKTCLRYCALRADELVPCTAKTRWLRTAHPGEACTLFDALRLGWTRSSYLTAE